MITYSILIAALVFASQNRQVHSTPPTPTQQLAFVGGRWRRKVHHQHQHQVSSSNINRCSCLRYPTNLLTSSTPSPSSYTSDNSKRGRLPSKSEQVSNKKHLKKVKASENRTRNDDDDDDDDDTITAKATKITNTTRIKREDKSFTNRGSTNDIPLRQETATYTIDIDNDTTTSTITSRSTIGGLLPNKAFTLLEHIHCTLTLLRKHFPTLLELPSLSTSTAQFIYEPNVTITGPKDETLAEGIDEVLLLNRALATTATAARRAGSLFDLATGSPTSSSSNNQGQVECKILIDPNNSQKVLVLWQTRLPSPFGVNNNRDDQSTAASSSPSSSSSSYTEFSGKSTLDLSPDTGLVTNLQINEVKVNGVALIESLGSALATVRRAARSAMATSSIFDDTGSSTEKRSSGNPLLDGILSGIQDVVDAVDALPTSEEKEEDGVLLDSQLYVVPMSYWKGSSFPDDENGILLNSTESMNDQQQVYTPVLIDEYTIRNGQVPLAGSELFVKYAINHKALQNFVENGLYQLAGISLADVTTETVRSLFATNAEIVTFGNDKKDYITLLSGAGKISDLYRTLALLRDASGGDFDIQSIEADLKMCQLIVHWKTETPLQIEGTDSFVFDTPQSESSSYRLPLSSDGDKDEVAERCSSFFDDQRYSALKICRIENLQLKVQGVNADSAWAQSFVAAVLRSGITENTPLPDTTITELLRALTTKKKDVATKKSMESAMPTLDSTAALSFYDIIRSLHADLPNISESSSPIPIPAGDYLAETMELRGLLGEVLVRGAPRYRQLLGVVLSSLHAATQTNAVRLATKPKPTIEITPKGSIKMNLVLALWVSPQLPLGGGQQNNNQGFGVPLKIDISSEYIIDETGKIREQIILESRLNGVLTPGDTFAKWVKGLTRNDDDSSNAPSAIDSFMGAVNLVRSMQGRK